MAAALFVFTLFAVIFAFAFQTDLLLICAAVFFTGGMVLVAIERAADKLTGGKEKARADAIRRELG